MKLRYGSAVVSFCPDLTSADEQSVPLAALIVGETDDGPVAALTWLHMVPSLFLKDDPMAAAILGDLPKLLRDHVDQAWEGIGVTDGSIEGVFLRLRNALRNSLHVSHVCLALESDLNDSDEEFVKGLFSILKETLRSSIPSGMERTPTVPARTNVTQSKPARRRNREFLMWEPSEARA